MVSVASWANAAANCTLVVDYQKLGFSEVQIAHARAKGFIAKAIEQFQPTARFASDSDVLFESSLNYFGLSGEKSPRVQPGWLLVIEP